MTEKLPPTDTGVCGTPKGTKRHWRKNETACRPCLDAYAVYRKTQGPRPKRRLEEPRNPTVQEIAAEIEFFLRCGEGTHAILKALGYAHNPASLRSRLRVNGYDQINELLFGESEAA